MGQRMEHGNWKSMYEAACLGDLELVRYYFDAGVDVDYIHPEVMSTALVSTIVAGQQEVALFLLERGADPTLLSPWEDMNPIQAAHHAGLESVQARLSALSPPAN